MFSCLLNQILSGDDITFDQALTLGELDDNQLNELFLAALRVTRHFYGNRVDLCSIINAKSGRCSENCAFCAQSARHKSNVMPVEVSSLDENEIIKNAKELWRSGVSRFSLVTSGEFVTDAEFDRILHIFKRLHKETKIGLCASLGRLTLERATKLKDAGISRYHHNIETSRSYFSQICSTHSYDDKINTINIARELGLEVCCGGIISMDETPEQRVEMAFGLKELDVDCIPINILNPIVGTRLEHQKPLSTDEIMRTIAVFRLILPDKTLRFAGGRERALGADEYKGYSSGINAMLVGNYLTTPGKAVEREALNLRMVQLELQPQES